jgi:hypothetical protein
MIFQFTLSRQHEHFETFIAHIENLCIQKVQAGADSGVPGGTEKGAPSAMKKDSYEPI